MAHKAHLEILKHGVDAWNRWRSDNPSVQPDLSMVDLSMAYLRNADLGKANLNGTNFSWADLRGAYLRNANLRRATLIEADLRDTTLGGANLNRVNLCGANLYGADLIEADFSGANLRVTNLEGSKVGLTVFGSNDLRVTKGLTVVHHMGPSTVGIDTLAQSKGQVPEAFLRGCGLSDWQIEASKLHTPGLANEEIGDILYRIHDLRARQSIQINPLFISYSHTDDAFVSRLEHNFVTAGIRFWRDVHHATAGRLEKQVDRAIRFNPTVLLVLSRDSTKSDWVEHEARSARQLEKELGRDVLCPIALDGSWEKCSWPDRLLEQIMEYEILDFSNWRDNVSFDRMYRKLVEGLDLFYRKEGA